MADRLDEIRQRVTEDFVIGGDVEWLLNEVDRLRAELDQSRQYRIGGDRG